MDCHSRDSSAFDRIITSHLVSNIPDRLFFTSARNETQRTNNTICKPKNREYRYIIAKVSNQKQLGIIANYRDYPKSTSTKLGLPLEYFSDLTKHSLPVQVGQRSRSPVEQTNPPEPSDPSMASESWGPQAPCRCKRSQNRWFREEVVLSPKRCKTPWPHRRCS